MDTAKKWTWISVLPVLVLSLTLFWNGSAFAKEKVGSSKVVILPFDIGVSGKFDYLRDGLRNMLAGRLAAKAGVVELDYSSYEHELKKLKSSPGKKKAGALLQQLKVDYLVSGTLYSLQEGLRLDLVFYPAAPGKEVVKFAASAPNAQAVIGAVNDISLDIAEKIFGIQKESVATAESVKDKDGLSGFETAHPERIFKKGIYSSLSLLGDQAGKLITSRNVKRSPSISMDIVAMDVADMNHDGKEEIVIASRGHIRIFHYDAEKFHEVGQISLPGYLKVHAVNLADLDNDTIKEIVISASRKYSPASSVVEWHSGDSFSYEVKDAPYYLRPVDMADGSGLRLIGQRGVADIAEEETVVVPGLYAMRLHQNTLEMGTRLSVPKSVNLFDFSSVDLTGDNVPELVVVNDKEKLLVYSHDNKLLWVSDDVYGGSWNYFGPPLIKDDYGIDRTLTYIPTRIITVDIDNDKIPEILIGRNKMSTLSEYRFLPNSRDYDNGFISCLSWNGKSMVELWRTNLLTGYIADYQFKLSNGAKHDVEGLDDEMKPGSDRDGSRSAKLWIAQVRDDGLLDLFSSKKGGNRLHEYQLGIPGKPLANKSE